MPSCHIITTDGPAIFQHIPGDGHAHIVEFGPEPGDRLEFSVVSYGDETMQLTADASISSMAVQEEAVSAPTLQASAHTPISVSSKKRRHAGSNETKDSVPKRHHGEDRMSAVIRHVSHIPQFKNDQLCRDVRKYHFDILSQIKGARDLAEHDMWKLLGEQIDTDPDEKKELVLSRYGEIRTLTQEFKKREAMTTLRCTVPTHVRTYVVRFNEPVRLDEVPGSPIVIVCANDGLRSASSRDHVYSETKLISAEASGPGILEGKLVTRVESEFALINIAITEGLAYVTTHHAWGYTNVDVYRTADQAKIRSSQGYSDQVYFSSVATRSGEIYISDQGFASGILKLGLRPNLWSGFYDGDDGKSPDTFQPSDLAFSDDGTLFISEAKNDRVRVISADGEYLRSWGGSGSALNQFRNPIGITTHGSHVYVADTGNNRIQVFDLQGGFFCSWGVTGGAGHAQFDQPSWIKVRGDYAYVSDRRGMRIQVLRVRDGAVIHSWNVRGIDHGDEYSGSMAFDELGRLWVCDDDAICIFV